MTNIQNFFYAYVLTQIRHDLLGCESGEGVEKALGITNKMLDEFTTEHDLSGIEY